MISKLRQRFHTADFDVVWYDVSPDHSNTSWRTQTQPNGLRGEILLLSPRVSTVTFAVFKWPVMLVPRRGPLLAWASDAGIKVMDVDKGKGGERISFVDKWDTAECTRNHMPQILLITHLFPPLGCEVQFLIGRCFRFDSYTCLIVVGALYWRSNRASWEQCPWIKGKALCLH